MTSCQKTSVKARGIDKVKSNRESGLGRYDVMLIPKNKTDLGIIMEFKKVGRFEEIDLEAAVASALKQQKNKKKFLEDPIHAGMFF